MPTTRPAGIGSGWEASELGHSAGSSGPFRPSCNHEQKALHYVAPKCYADRVETRISQRELRNDSGTIMRRVEQGERFTVTRNRVPVADLVPHDRAAADRRRRFVPVAEVAIGVNRLPNWDVERFAAEQRQLDAAVDDSDAERWGTAR
ncbi:MAG: type II toxin-antitoxin system Phd/YefM family antitoxin [Mycobacterium sp.]